MSIYDGSGRPRKPHKLEKSLVPKKLISTKEICDAVFGVESKFINVDTEKCHYKRIQKSAKTLEECLDKLNEVVQQKLDVNKYKIYVLPCLLAFHPDYVRVEIPFYYQRKS
jgi:hypothetical protein